jgi:hypothetical protein
LNVLGVQKTPARVTGRRIVYGRVPFISCQQSN